MPLSSLPNKFLLLMFSLCATLSAGAGDAGPGAASAAPASPGTTANAGASTKQDNPIYVPPAQIAFPPSHAAGYLGDFKVNNIERERRVFGELIHSRVQLPPEMPMLGAPLPVMFHKGDALPQVLRSAQAEPFFTPLTALMREGGRFSARFQARVEAYAGQRARALEALRAGLGTGGDAMVGLPGCDEALLAAQEAEAESLRSLMAQQTDNVRWTERDSWVPASEESTARQAGDSQFLLALSCFQEGLSLEQRELLREIAQRKPSQDGGRVLAFSPFGTSLRLPAKLEPATASLISEYEVLKGSLCGDLTKAVHENEATWFEGVRTRRLEELRAVQAGAFQRLEVLAERIRVALAGVALPDEPPRPVLSAGVRQRLSDYLHEKAGFQRSLVESLVELRGRFPNRGIELARESEGVTVVLRQGLGRAAEVEANRLTERIRRDYAALDRKRRAVVDEIAAETASRGGQPPAPIDQLAGDFAKALLRQETWARYEDYRTAMLRPGLSPRQRRLVLSEALRSLVPVASF